MIKWDYKKVSTHQMQNSDELDVLFEQAGNQGWELVMSFGQLLIFKRPQEERPVKNPATRKPKYNPYKK